MTAYVKELIIGIGSSIGVKDAEGGAITVKPVRGEVQIVLDVDDGSQYESELAPDAAYFLGMALIAAANTARGK